jgi:RHS repeat-associated protein
MLGAIMTVMTAFTLVGCGGGLRKTMSERYVYDRQGRLSAKTLPGGQKMSFKYDNRDEITEIGYRGGWVRYGYDANGNRAWMRDPTGTTEYYYDAFDRLVGVVSKHSPWWLIAYDYDSRDNLTRLSAYALDLLEQEGRYKDWLGNLRRNDAEKEHDWQQRERQFAAMLRELRKEDPSSSGKWLPYDVRYEYDVLGNVTGIDTKWGKVSYDYSPDQGTVVRHLPNGVTSRFGYSPDGLLTSVRHENGSGQLIAGYDYDFNAAGKVVSVNEITEDGQKSTGYVWDTRGYLKELALPDGGKMQYEYDAMGNRTRVSGPGGTTDYSYDSYGRLTAAGDRRYEWDGNGYLSTQLDGGRKTRLAYDGRGLPKTITTPDVRQQFRWDGDGNLISCRTGKEVVHILANPIAPLDLPLIELDGDGAVRAGFLYGDGLLGTCDVNGKMDFLLEDGFSSLRYATGQNGQVLGRRTYTPFAELVETQGNIPSPYRMAGERYIPDVDLYTMGGRLYDPKTARYDNPNPFPGFKDRFDSQNGYAHSCNATRVFMEPRCNQTHGGSRGSSSWEPGGRWFGLQYGKRSSSGSWGWTLTGNVIGILAKRELGPELGKGIGSLFGIAWGFLPPLAQQNQRIRAGGPNMTWDDVSAYAQAFLTTGASLGAGYITGGNPYVSTVAGWTAKLTADGAKEVATFWGTRSVRPYWIWSPMKWMPDEQYQQARVAQYKTLPKGGRMPDLPPPDLGPRRDEDNPTRRFFPFPPDWPDGGGGGAAAGASDPFVPLEKQLGGIELAATAEFSGDLGTISGAVYDPDRQVLVLLGDEQATGPSLRAEDLAVALRLVYGPNPQDPQFTLDPADPKNVNGKWLKAVYIPEQVLAGTAFGQTMFEADWLLKQYAFGVEIDSSGKVIERRTSVSGFKSEADLMYDEPASGSGSESWARQWIVSDEMRLKQSGSSMLFDVARMRVKAKKIVPDPTSPQGFRDVDSDEPIARKFAEQFTQRYDELARESPALERVRELAKAVALAKWLKQTGVPVDVNWVDEYANRRDSVTVRVAALSVGRTREDRKPFAWGESIITRQVQLFGGVDLTVKPELVSGDDVSRAVQKVVVAKLSQRDAGPTFRVVTDVGSYRAVVAPTTERGQEMWRRPASVEAGGTSYEFNEARKVIRSTDQDGTISEYAYGPDGRLSGMSVAAGTGWKVSAVRGANGSTWKATNPKHVDFDYRCDESGHLVQVDVAGEPLATYRIDDRARQMTARYSDHTERVTYDAEGNARRYELAMRGTAASQVAQSVIYEYNASGGLTRASSSNGEAVSIAYSDDGRRPTQITTPRGGTAWSYDGGGRLVGISGSDGDRVTCSYDDGKLSRAYVQARGSEAHYLFGPDGVVRSNDLLGGLTEYSYSDGHMSSVKAEGYGGAEYRYDELGRMKQTSLPSGVTVEYDYEETKGRKGAQGHAVTITTRPAMTDSQDRTQAGVDRPAAR